MGHAGAADGLNERLFDDAILNVERQLACALLGSAPANAMSKAGNILDLLSLNPLALFRDWSRAMVRTLGDTYHFLNFARVLHGSSSFFLSMKP